MKAGGLAAVSAAVVCSGCLSLPWCDGHPDSTGPEWEDVFNRDLSNAVLAGGPCTNNLWAWDAEGCLTPNTTDTLLSKKSWGSFVLDCEYKCDETGNSGIFFYDTVHPSAKIEMQILDDRHPMYLRELPYQFTGSLYGHCPASKVVSKGPGEWNRVTIWARGDDVKVILNGEKVVDADLSDWKSQLVNPDGTDIPPWQRTFVPWARLPKCGRIGLQGIHGGKAAHFRYLRIKALDPEPAHPADTSDWQDLVKRDLSNVEPTDGVWSFDKEGCLVATKDVNLVTKETYANFALDLEFKMAPGANAGVFVYASDLSNWIPNKMEIQLMDDADPRNAKYPDIWKNCSLYGHMAAWANTLKPAGEWNRLTVYCQDKRIRVAQNGVFVLETDLDNYTDAVRNPDGSTAPKPHTKPYCQLATYGRIGLQGCHGGIATKFRNLKVKVGK